jgi:hypothetical protein
VDLLALAAEAPAGSRGLTASTHINRETIMEMDWRRVAGKLVTLGAPMIGSALGGPLGGMAGKIVADAFGAAAATPEAVQAAIVNKGDADLRIAAEAAQQAEAQWMSALAEIGKAQVSEVGETMRAEAGSEDTLQRWWRPLYALELSLLECPAFALTLLHALGPVTRPESTASPISPGC